MEKQAYRAKFKQARLKLGSSARSEKSALINQQLLQITEWSKVRNLHVYEPINKLGEVDISSFVEQIEKQHPEINIYTSRKIAEKWRITSIGGESLEQLPDFDVIIVPMLGFDKKLHRIGYGGGYYDRFLATQLQAAKIGVCFEQLQVDQLPIETNDIAMDKIITESTIYAL